MSTGERNVRRYLMIGAPVSAVRTPPLLEDYLAGQGVSSEVSAVAVTDGDLDAFMRDLRSDPSVDGLLVTMPHKKAVMPFLDAVSTTARLAASVNTIKRTEFGGLVGAQFDGVALVRALIVTGAPIAISRVLVVGLGGAGAAIAHAIASHGCGSLHIWDIDAERTEEVSHGLRDSAACELVATPEPSRDSYDILVNATPLGMRAGDPSPFAATAIAHARWIADIVADPPRTRLAELAKAAGKHFITGRQMVESQIEPIGRWLLAPDIEQDGEPLADERDE